MSTHSPLSELLASRAPQRVRHPLQFRQLTVQQVERITPHLLRVTVGGPALEGFYSPGFDDHVKLFFPDPATGVLALPETTPEGLRFPEGQPRPAARDYTPRHHDPEAGTLVIDFALHDAGPATAWAMQAAPGQSLHLAGPRGSMLIPTTFDWHLLIGDDTALPAIARRLAELPTATRAVVLAEIDTAADQVLFTSNAEIEVHWVYRQGAIEPQPLLTALQALTFPEGDYHAWIAGETQTSLALRRYLIESRNAHPKWVKAAGYWRRGVAAVHETHADD